MQAIINAMLEEYLLLEADVKPKLKRIEEIKTWCRSQGTFKTNEFVCSVTTSERVSIAPLEKVARTFGLDVLKRNDLIQTTTSRMVKVSRIESVIPTKEGP